MDANTFKTDHKNTYLLTYMCLLMHKPLHAMACAVFSIHPNDKNYHQSSWSLPINKCAPAADDFVSFKYGM
jgi:hypothetical protein